MLDSRLLRPFVLCALVLLAGHLLGLVAREAYDVNPRIGIVRQFDLNAEGNLAAWFSSFLLLLSAGLCLLVARIRALRDEPLAGRWAAFAAFFLLMAIDETSQLHDLATRPVRNALGLDFGILYFAWLLPALLVVAAAAYWFRPLVAAMSDAVRPRLVIAAIVYLTGAVGFEMLGGEVVADGHYTLRYLLTMTCEESLEIAGGLLFLAALLAQVRELRPELVVRWTGPLPEVVELHERQPRTSER
ncbi:MULTISPECIES: hypothetical protein [unclassified Nocardioides]|uniref:hypothetical protein n=1 Tax=unclassified Nocardioides TaxID=2615069 RepID=UPI0007035EA1|nr:MULTISPECIES: hypothetical protein [unclassified Nocardioides]KRC54074.1 hypothetical protein ASE19_08405 [Nocardioides sp. Root79]KRC71410.1 hypothetical protein ASE20_10820 [Nocardioides sp. Root240]